MSQNDRKATISEKDMTVIKLTVLHLHMDQDNKTIQELLELCGKKKYNKCLEKLSEIQIPHNTRIAKDEVNQKINEIKNLLIRLIKKPTKPKKMDVDHLLKKAAKSYKKNPKKILSLLLKK